MRKIILALVAAASAGLAAGALLLAPGVSSASLKAGPARSAARGNLQPAQNAGNGWTIQPMPIISGPSGNASIQLTRVSCALTTSCTAVGSYIFVSGAPHGPQGGTLAEHWNGRTWKVQVTPSPSSSSALTGISCASATSCTAVGYRNSRGGTLAEHWNGRKWKVQVTPSPSSSSALTGISCASATSCTAVGYRGFGRGTLAEHWNGRKWKIQATPNPSQAGSYFDSVSCVSASSCTATGQGTNAVTGNQFTLAEHWNGRKWKIQATRNPSHMGSYFDSVSCFSASSCTATGLGIDAATDNEFTLAEHWNGSTWTVQATPSPVALAVGLYGVACASALSCTAVGSYYTGGAAGFNFPLAEQWNGKAQQP